MFEEGSVLFHIREICRGISFGLQSLNTYMTAQEFFLEGAQLIKTNLPIFSPQRILPYSQIKTFNFFHEVFIHHEKLATYAIIKETKWCQKMEGKIFACLIV